MRGRDGESWDRWGRRSGLPGGRGLVWARRTGEREMAEVPEEGTCRRPGRMRAGTPQGPQEGGAEVWAYRLDSGEGSEVQEFRDPRGSGCQNGMGDAIQGPRTSFFAVCGEAFSGRQLELPRTTMVSLQSGPM